MSMFGRNQVSDRDLLKTVNQRLARTGTASQSKVNVNVQHGVVTLTGSLQYAIQRSSILKAITRVPGVSRVVDQLQMVAKKGMRHDDDSQRRYQQPAERESPSEAAIELVDESPDEPTRSE
jgi:hypothetical protein